MTAEELERFMAQQLTKMNKKKEPDPEPKNPQGGPRDKKRDAAIARGEKRYYGNPCKYGHDGLRMTSTQDCVHCRKIRESTEEFKAERRRKQALQREGRVHNTVRLKVEGKRHHERWGKQNTDAA